MVSELQCNGIFITNCFSLPVKPTLLSGLPKKLDAIEGRNISVTCRASGKPAARIIWLKDGSPLRNTPPYYVTGRRPDNTYESASQLTLAPARRTDNGNYGCQAINLHGSNQQNVKLNLLCKYYTISHTAVILEHIQYYIITRHVYDYNSKL